MAERQEAAQGQGRTVRTGQQSAERQSKTRDSTEEVSGSSTCPHPSTTSRSLFQARIASRHSHTPILATGEGGLKIGSSEVEGRGIDRSEGRGIDCSEVEGRGTGYSVWLDEELSETMLGPPPHFALGPSHCASDGETETVSLQDLTISFTDSEMDVSGFDSECDEEAAQVVPQSAQLSPHKGGSAESDSSDCGDPFDSLDLTEAATPTTTSGEESFSDGQWEEFLSPLASPPTKSTPLPPTAGAAPARLVPAMDSPSCAITEEDLWWDESVPAPHSQSLCTINSL